MDRSGRSDWMGRVMDRGDIVLCNLQGDYSKTSPAVIVQSDLFNPTHASIIVCPITSFLVDASLFRLSLTPSEKNGLLKPSQIMVDKMLALKREKICQRVGHLSPTEQNHLDNALKLWLSLILA